MTSRPAEGPREWTQVLSREPDRFWPEGLLHHGVRILLLVGLATLVTALFPPTPRLTVVRYEEGMVADEDITAQIPFGFPRSPDELGVERAAAVA